jgi:hypothetical protein
MRVKVYIVQRARPDGSIDPTIVAAKLTHALAHNIAKDFAPARVVPLIADKTPGENGETSSSSRGGSSGPDRD